MNNAPKETDTADKNTLSALLSHFRRSGIQFMPSANLEQVQLILSQTQSISPVRAPIPVPRTKPTPVTGPIIPVMAKPSSRLSPAPVLHPASAPKLEPYLGASLPVVERISALNEIAAEVVSCTRCEALSSSRKLTVPGEGNPAARICFLGEAPGADEDATGRPFVGRAGQLLTKMIEACTFSREEVFILNTIKCHPPGNRNPAHDEIENCRGFLERQLELVRPEYIVCLGLVAAQTLLHSKLSIGRLRGQFHGYRGSKVLVTYHPSYLLREPEVKKAAWADLQFLLRDMGIELPKK